MQTFLKNKLLREQPSETDICIYRDYYDHLCGIWNQFHLGLLAINYKALILITNFKIYIIKIHSNIDNLEIQSKELGQ